MKSESQNYIDRLKTCPNLSERKIINDEFNVYYKTLTATEKAELIPYFDNLKHDINHKMNKIDVLVSQAESILSKCQRVEV